MMRPRTIRDPVWGNIRLGAEAAKIVDTPEFQRLRRVKQLGVTHLVYPGGVHSRFLHAVGVYHLVSTAIAHLEREGHLDALSDEDRADIPVVHLAALLHDVGHYAFSHAMEELRPESMLGHHEEIATQFLEAGPIKGVLANHGPDVVQRIGKLICGESTHPLQGLIAGSFDLDKIDYLRRDALFCGVPYGAIDVDRLLQALTLAREEDDGVFAKFQAVEGGHEFAHHLVLFDLPLHPELLEQRIGRLDRIGGRFPLVDRDARDVIVRCGRLAGGKGQKRQERKEATHRGPANHPQGENTSVSTPSDLADKRVIITAGASGIGRVVAQRFVEAGITLGRLPGDKLVWAPPLLWGPPPQLWACFWLLWTPR